MLAAASGDMLDAAMAARLTGALYTFQTHFLYVGALIASARHKHHAGQVMWVPGGLVVEDEDGTPHHGAVHLVPPDRSHGHGAAAAAAVLWVDRDDLQWERRLTSPPHEVCRGFPAAMVEQLDASVPADAARELAQGLLDLIAPVGGAREHVPRHPAVMRMCALLDSGASEREISVTQLARQSGLSMRQLRHRITEQLGINPRAYLRWRRLRRAIASIERGATLTEAALEGGFADGAHFSRVFQAQFGMAPSQAVGSIHFAGALAPAV